MSLLIKVLVTGGATAICLLWMSSLFFGTEPLVTEDESLEDRSILTRIFGRRMMSAFHKLTEEGVVGSIAVGLAVGLIRYFTPKTANLLWINFLFLAFMIVVQIYLMVIWKHNGSNLKEMIPFLVLAVLFYYVDLQVVSMLSIVSIGSAFWSSVLSIIPRILHAGAIGFYLVDAVWFYYKNKAENSNGEEGNSVLPIVALALLILGLLAMIIFMIDWKALGEPAPETPIETESTEPVSESDTWYMFYNLYMLNDEDKLNDYNFGYNPYREDLTTDQYFNDLKFRLGKDPALGAAVMGYVDCKMNMGFLHKFYVEDNWLLTINRAKEAFTKDQEGYYKLLYAFVKFLQSSDMALGTAKVTKDQMFMNPYTDTGVPNVVIMETAETDGHFLIFTFNIKGKEMSVMLRIECGYQPTDVSKIMKVTPESNPNKDKPNPGPDPDPDPTPSNPKDKTKGTQGDVVGPNDNPGPGPDTNNGVGATESTKDQPSNSNHMTFEEYEKKMDELEEVNRHQKTGDDSNTPSTTVPGAKVDNNSDDDMSTDVGEKAKGADGTPISENPAGQWGGPQD